MLRESHQSGIFPEDEAMAAALAEYKPRTPRLLRRRPVAAANEDMVNRESPPASFASDAAAVTPDCKIRFPHESRKRRGRRRVPQVVIEPPARPLQWLLGRPHRAPRALPVAFTTQVKPSEILRCLAIPAGWTPSSRSCEDQAEPLKTYEGPRSKRARLAAEVGA